jgi:hypothetical protein
MREQWKQGLQWGAVAVVARWLAPWVVYPLWWATGEMGDKESWRLMRTLDLGATVPIFALIVVTWTRYSRLAVAALIVVFAWQLEPTFATFPSSLAVRVICVVRPYAELVSLLPLLFITPERPRLTVALALLGRWREAARTLAGWRWPLVAVGVLLFRDVAGVFARSFGGMSADNAPAVLCWDVCDTFCAIGPFLAPFLIAALPPWRRLATA